MGEQQYSWGKRRQGQEVDSGQHDVVIPWLTLGGIIPLPGVHLEEGILSLQGQKMQKAPLSGH